MEGEKERQRQQREEKESNEAEDNRTSDEDADNDEVEEEEDSECAALVWQEGYGEDNLGLPIMHWEALSLRIAELEKQEEENKEKKAKVCRLGKGGSDTFMGQQRKSCTWAQLP